MEDVTEVRFVVRVAVLELIFLSNMVTELQTCSLIRDTWSKCDSPAVWSCLKSLDFRSFQWLISSYY